MTDPRVKQWFMQAVDLPAAERRGWLAAQTSDAALIEQVMQLLEAHAASPTLAPPVRAIRGAVDSTAQPPADLRVGQRIGEYEILRSLGEGGFGKVFLAQQHEPLSRQVAIKILHAGMNHRQVVDRFEAERQVLAMMDHPNIARVFDAGSTPDGRPFIVMEYVDGMPITRYCDEHGLALSERLSLFAQVCMAVQHAHQKGVIHRDLKPSNILVGEVDGRPMPKVIDFGVAKAVDDIGGLALTREFQVIGTPQYMSPEQAKYGAARLDTRSDLYSLGAVLYELVTGAPPFEAEELQNASLEQVLRLIQEKTPARPSTKISQQTSASSAIAERTINVTPSKLRKLLAGDVDWIVMKALEKEPPRRYQTAVELAEDIERFLANRPVLAGPPSRIYQLRKFTRRHRVEVAAAALVLLSLVAAVAVSAMMAVRAHRAEAAAKQSEASARRELAKANAVVDFTESLLAGVGPGVARGRDTTLLKDLLNQAAAEAPQKLKDQPLIDLFLRDQIAGVWYDLGEVQKAKDLLKPAWDRTESLQGQDSIDRLSVGSTLGEILGDLNEYDESRSLLQNVLAKYESLGMERSPQYADTLGALAGVYLNLSRWSEAERLAGQAVQLNRELGRSGNTNGTLVQNTLANSIFRRGAYAEATKVFEEIVALQVQHFGENHPDTFNARRNLGISYRMEGKYDKAIEQMELALSGSRKVLEPGSYDMVMTLSSTGDMHSQYGDRQRGFELVQEAYQQAQLKLPPEHEARISTAMTFARAKINRGDCAEGAKLSEQALTTSIKAFGPNDRRVAEALALTMEALRGDKRPLEGLAALKKYEPAAWDEGTSGFYRAKVDAAAARLFLSVGDIDEARRRAARARQLLGDKARGRVLDEMRMLDEMIAAAATQPATTLPTTLPAR